MAFEGKPCLEVVEVDVMVPPRQRQRDVMVSLEVSINQLPERKDNTIVFGVGRRYNDNRSNLMNKHAELEDNYGKR